MAVHDILEHRIAQSGLELPAIGSHVLRHSLAVDLLRRGEDLPTIGATLGHRDVESTAVYLRLAIEDLRDVGLPVPTGASATRLHCHGWKRKLVPSEKSPKVRLRRAGFRSGLATSLRRYLTTQRALGRAYRVEEESSAIGTIFSGVISAKYVRSSRKCFNAGCKRCRQLFMPPFAAIACGLSATSFSFTGAAILGISIPDPLTFPRPVPHQPPRLVSPVEDCPRPGSSDFAARFASKSITLCNHSPGLDPALLLRSASRRIAPSENSSFRRRAACPSH